MSTQKLKIRTLNLNPSSSRSRIKKDEASQLFENDVLLKTRVLYLGDYIDDNGESQGIDAYVSSVLIKSLHLLTSDNAEAPIKIILNSFGGCWWNGMAIYGAIKSLPCSVEIVVYGSAMSMASVILQAGDKRILDPDATVMIHDGYDGADLPVRSFENWGEYSKKHLRRRMYEIYSQKSGKPPKFWEKRCAHDYILTAAEAVELGLADEILQRKK